MRWWIIADADDIQNELSEDNNEQRGTVFIEARGDEQRQPDLALNRGGS